MISLIEQNKKIKQITNMVLITYLGAYVSSKIIKDIDIEVFGWFSDRDAINDLEDYTSVDFIRYYLNEFTEGKNFAFAFAPADCKSIPFYEELVRIPDYIAGTLADYDIENNRISKDKFDVILSQFMAKNNANNFIYKFYSKNGLSFGRLIFNPKVEE